MLAYLKKFTLDILPSIIATIVGAFIVHHYVIPAATPKSPATTVVNADPKADAAKSDPAPVDRPTFSKGVAEKAAIEKAAEKAAEKSGEPASPDSRKRHATRKASPVEQTASVPDTAPAEERRDANDLARAAIERLRGTEPARTVAIAPAQPALPLAPPPVAATPPEVFSAGTGAIVAPARPVALPPPVVRSADASKPTPPAEIPGQAPLELHGDVGTTGRATTVVDDAVSAAKSVFHAVLPR